MAHKNYFIESQRLLIRQLSYEDNIDDYLSWMQNLNNTFIESVDSNISKNDLYNYINEKNSKPNALLLGIFDKQTNKHIGNGKFEPINYSENFAVMGLFIGDVGYRGKGVFKEFIECCVNKILLPMGIKTLLLGVNKENVSAIKAYSKAGFRRTQFPRLELGINGIELELNI